MARISEGVQCGFIAHLARLQTISITYITSTAQLAHLRRRATWATCAHGPECSPSTCRQNSKINRRNRRLWNPMTARPPLYAGWTANRGNRVNPATCTGGRLAREVSSASNLSLTSAMLGSNTAPMRWHRRPSFIRIVLLVSAAT